MQLLFFLYSDPEAVLKKVQKIEELIATIEAIQSSIAFEGLAEDTEVGADGIVHCWPMISILCRVWTCPRCQLSPNNSVWWLNSN